MSVGDFNPEPAAASFASKAVANALEVSIPGVGIVAAYIVGRLLKKSAEKEASKVAHFRDNVLTPMINALKAGNFSQAAAMVTMNTPGDAGEEHAGYLLSRYPQTAAIMNQAALGAALSGNVGLAMQYAAMLDHFKQIGEQQRLISERIAADEKIAESKEWRMVTGDDGESHRVAPVGYESDG